MRNGSQEIATRDYRDVIAKVASVKDLDVDKLQQLMKLQEDYEKRQATEYYNRQMAAAQAEMAAISRDAANPITHSKYATLAALDNAIRPIYTKYGFSVSFDEELMEKDGWFHCVAYVSCGAETRRYHRWLPWTTQGLGGRTAMTPTHANMSANTYIRRALLKNIFNLAEEDDDGNRAGGRYVPQRQIVEPFPGDDPAPLTPEETTFREQAINAAKRGENALHALYRDAAQEQKALLRQWKTELTALYPQGVVQ